MYVTPQPRLSAEPMLGGALLAPVCIVPKLVGVLLSVGSIPLLRGDRSILATLFVRHSLTVARIGPCG